MKKVFLRTFGCQMNEHDSERIRDLLIYKGYSISLEPADADVLLFNTCSVRRNAEERVFGVVGSLKKLRKKNPDVIFGILGCMAEAQKEKIFERLPHVNFICGPADLDKVSEMIKESEKKKHFKNIGSCKSGKLPVFPKKRETGERAYVKIMEGCDNFCSYCIVPYVRGPERSRQEKEIIEEIDFLIKKGVKDITLLGQNVNSYGRGLKEKTDFPGLLRRINSLIGKKDVGVGFITSHPKDAGVELFKAMAGCGTLSKNLHLAMQSGSDKILKKMNRGYTIKKYRDLVKDFRRIVKGETITTDIIVGFPGETQKDFEETLKAVKDMEFDGAYIFKYSPRPFTKAARYKDNVPKEEKERRHALLLETQRKISKSKRK